jgi:hypothetical protein
MIEPGMSPEEFLRAMREMVEKSQEKPNAEAKSIKDKEESHHNIRSTKIGDDDVANLKIALETMSVEDFIKKM